MGIAIFVNKRFICLMILIFLSAMFIILKILKLQLTYKYEECKGCEDIAAILWNKSIDPVRSTPLIFVGGEPRSGTTLMRAMLDVHPDVNCGPETYVIPQLLRLHHLYFVSPTNYEELQATGLKTEVVDNAFAKFFGEIITKHGAPSKRYCNKDPQTMQFADYLVDLFPNSKFVFMIRDGRATVHSIIANNVSIDRYDNTDYRQCLERWNVDIENMVDKCSLIGADHCLMVYYEQLVLHPKEVMQKVLDYLNLPWSNNVLHHEQFINKPNGVQLSAFEYSTNQVRLPIYLSSLSSWVGKFPEDVVRDMSQIAPMLAVLGYDPTLNPPDYKKMAF